MKLKSDPAVVAAWLSGSLGRGNGDALSDLDLWVILNDEAADQRMARLRQYTAVVRQPVLFLEAPQNAPEGGAYLMACYDALIAPHIVDWYFQPQFLAVIPLPIQMLFNRANLAHQDHPVRFRGGGVLKDNVESPMYFISFFWMMLMISAKHTWRYPWSEELPFLEHLTSSLAKAREFLGVEENRLVQSIPPSRLPGEKVQLLELLADQMRQIMSSMAERGVEVPDQVVPGVFRYLNMIRPVVEDRQP